MGFFCVASVFYEKGVSPATWALLLFNGFVWPHVAYGISLISKNPGGTERGNLLIDSLFGGFWVPLMSFNLLPSVTIITMLSMDNIAVGGWRFFLKGLAAQLVGAVVALAATDFHFAPHSTTFTIMASLPMLVLYPLIIGMITYKLARKLADHNKNLRDLSRTDGLTALNNRVYWEDLAVGQFEDFLWTGKPATALLIDIDHFKMINDQYGHGVGDETLRTVADLIKQSLSPHDMAGRYGGEEFGIIMPDKSAKDAHAFAERLRKKVEATVLHQEHNIHCTISIGIAQLTGDLENFSQWIETADKALYRAKNKGRNQSVIADQTANLIVVQSGA